jgi:O-succinylbenzoic acid--CoA ligase
MEEIKQELRLVHPSFSIEGINITKDQLSKVAYSYIKEGEAFEKEIGMFLLDWLTDKDTVKVRTSGTTGEPKIMHIKKAAMYGSALATADYFNLSPNSKILHCLPCEYIAGKMMLVRAMVLGLNIHFVEPTSNPIEKLKERVEFCAMVPLQAENSLQYLDKIGMLIIGGAPISEELEMKIVEAIDPITTRVYQTFGMTETLSHIAVRPIHKDSLKEKKFMTVKGVKISSDNRGCLLITAPQLFSGQLVTNDLVTINHDFSFTWLGRIDYLINSGGIKIIPENVEKKIKQLVKGNFFLYGLEDKKLGQKLSLITEEDQDADLLEQIASLEEVEKYKVPKEVIKTGPFVFTSNGKLRREKTVNKYKLH